MNTIKYILIVFLNLFVFSINCSDITNAVFGSIRDGMPAAFGDFNSDELTDVFVLRNNRKTVEVLLAAEEEPLLRSHNLSCSFSQVVTSVVPGDFDGDAFMDILVTTSYNDDSESHVHIIWGGLDNVNCTNKHTLLKLHGQPLAIDYNHDMIIDLFGLDEDGGRSLWEFNKTRDLPPKKHDLGRGGRNLGELQTPHSHAYLDLNNDYTADLFLTAKEGFEIWHGVENSSFQYNRSVLWPDKFKIVGQSIFIDVELIGRADLVTPVCFDKICSKSAIMVYAAGSWHDLQVDFKDNSNTVWQFVHPEPGHLYCDTITLRSGDFNLDGYPDLLVTLKPNSLTTPIQPHAFLLENVPSKSNSGAFSRTFAVQWNALSLLSNGSIMAAFYDLYQDGILDVLVVRENGTSSAVAAFKNSLDYDANFIKVMVLTGLTNPRSPTVVGRLGKKKRTYGTNLPGPKISYNTTTQDGAARHGASAQLPQSAHMALGLPYTIFGLGRTPNFVDSLTVGLSHKSRDWVQIIPNSQMVVIPWPTQEPMRWRAQLFVTPSKLILMSVAALTAVCGVITVIIGVLYWRERQEDRKERLQESHRFHFDAM